MQIGIAFLTGQNETRVPNAIIRVFVETFDWFISTRVYKLQNCDWKLRVFRRAEREFLPMHVMFNAIATAIVAEEIW